ncbi:MAG: BACON domain-containing protein [Mediterranea sp.]|jgi:hypothetical protein|nr:BACON domain-containing protein [Mediterranea sp.]
MNAKLKMMLGCFLLLTVGLAGCSDDDAKKGNDIEIAKDVQTQTFYADDVQTASGLSFSTKGPWTSTVTDKNATRANATWLTITPDKGDAAGDYTINLTMDTNYSGADRTATITILSGASHVEINVTQKAGKKDSPDTPLIMGAPEAKERLAKIGKEAAAMVNADDLKKLTQLSNRFYDISGYWGEKEDYLSTRLTSNQPEASMQRALRSMVSAAHGNFGELYALTRLSGYYDLPGYYAIRTYNESTHRWDQQASTTECTWKFKCESEDAQIKVTQTGATSNLSIDDYTVVEVPEQLNAVITMGGSTLLTLVVKASNVNDALRTINLDITQDANGYVATAVASLKSQKITGSGSFTIKGKVLTTAAAEFSLDSDNNPNGGQGRVSLLDQAQVELACPNYVSYKKAYNKVEEQYNYDYKQEAAEALAKVNSQYIGGNLSFPNVKEPAAILTFGIYLVDIYEYQGYKREDWDIENRLKFSDGTEVSLDSFMDNDSGPFKSLTDSFTKLLNSFQAFIK